MLTINNHGGDVSVTLDGKEIFTYTGRAPALFLGKGAEKIEMYRGNFRIEDRISERLPLCFDGRDGEVLRFSEPVHGAAYSLTLREEDGLLFAEGGAGSGDFNRLWIRFPAEKGEHVTGGGEQFSALDLRGKLYPVWTREQGVGRNKLSEVTRLADAADGGGGDYHTTFFPQPTYVSSRMYFMHLENYEYSELDFRAEDFHELGVWATGVRLVFAAGKNYRELLGKLTKLLGRQPELPEWSMKGLWMGVQGGTQRVLELRDRCVRGGVEVSAVWIQDWVGRRITSFGKRLQWDWRWNRELYPGLDRVIAEDPGCAWMGYINPYLVEGGALFREAKEHGYFVKKTDGSDYLFDFGEFDCGVVDLTAPEAFAWYKDVIKKNLIGMGFRGWMADFGEYLPADAVCAGGTGARTHNAWPMLWAKCNREAVEESGLLGECVFYMRAGAAGSQRYSTLTWAGDQCVDWSEDDGLPSVITSALSLGMSGYGLHCSDAGGYTTLFHLRRDRELLLRWLEFACFTPVMRTHEGNRPDDNVQLYSEDGIIEQTARLTRIHTKLLPYMKRCVEENSLTGVPVMRPLFLDEPDLEAAYGREPYSYLLGDDVLVAPVVEQGADTRTVLFPRGDWEHLWTGARYGEGTAEVGAPLGKPPVFFRTDSAFAELFREISAM